MKVWQILIMGSVFVLFFYSCTQEGNGITSIFDNIFDGNLEAIRPTPQRAGDPEKGRQYLLEGDYLDSGIPVAFFGNLEAFFGGDNVLNRKGLNAKIPPEFTISKALNGVDIIVPNCLQCHGGYINGEYILGLGNSAFDGTLNQGFLAQALGNVIKVKFSEDSPEWEAFEQFYDSGVALNGNISTQTVGTNSADKITEVLLAHRDRNSLMWDKNAIAKIAEEVIPTDPPAWWLLKKKNAQFTTGIGRGDFARISMASSLLTMEDSAKAEEVDGKFVDVLAFIKSLEAPQYPGEIDMEKVKKGAKIFEKKCSKCHGIYGDKSRLADGQASYPNYLVHLDKIGTDPRLARSYHERPEFSERYNSSWFAKGAHGARIVPGDGYVAPPLDGVWATAPYLHNGSVATIREMLNSQSRPKYWRRSFDSEDYSWENLGWKYVEKSSKIDKYTYDITLLGYSNQGHTFGDDLSSAERSDLLEYLKTL